VLSSVTALASIYALAAFAEAKVSSLDDTVAKSVSRTPDAKSATSKLLILLPVPLASIVLFVKVSVASGASSTQAEPS